MHDLLEGVAPYEIALILDALKVSKFITLDDLDCAITSFDYNFTDIGSILPTLTSLNSLKISASEMWCFLRNLPLLIRKYVPREEKNWKLLLLLLDICDIVFSPTVTKSLDSFLSHIIAEHHSYFKELFPDETLLPKHYFKVHYPRCLVTSGPLIPYWCMRFEARHNFLKELGRIIRCYKNICKTLAKRFQFSLASLLLSGQLHSSLEYAGPAKEIIIELLEPEIAQCVMSSLKLCSQDTIFTLKYVEIGYHTFKEESIGVIDVINGIAVWLCGKNYLLWSAKFIL